MAKRKWWQVVFPFLRLFAKKVEDGEIGAGKKTSDVGKVAGEVLDAVDEATKE